MNPDNAANPLDIILLGVIHSDPKGRKRTTAFLSRYRPDLILVEISPFALDYRRKNSPRLYREFRKNLRAAADNLSIAYLSALKHPQMTRIGRQLHIPFEYRASAAYCKTTGAEVVPADWSDFSRRWIDTWPELISVENLESLLRLGDTPVLVSKNYDLAARTIVGNSPAPSQDPEEARLWQKREEKISAEILSRIELRKPIRPLYIGGWRHLLSDGPFRTVRDILGIGLSNCFLLDRGPISA